MTWQLVRPTVLVVLAAAAGAMGCQPEKPEPSVVGRWQRVDQPSEWMEFGADSSFRSRSFTGTNVVGRYRQHGDSLTVTIIPEGHGATLVLRDTLLVMEEGTRYRRAAVR